MRPPHCYVCDRGLGDSPGSGREAFTLVYFGATDDAKMHDSRLMARLGRAGHPRNAAWFCNQHVHLGRKHEDMETRAALAAIDSAIGRKRHAPTSEQPPTSPNP